MPVPSPPNDDTLTVTVVAKPKFAGAKPSNAPLYSRTWSNANELTLSSTRSVVRCVQPDDACLSTSVRAASPQSKYAVPLPPALVALEELPPDTLTSGSPEKPANVPTYSLASQYTATRPPPPPAR